MTLSSHRTAPCRYLESKGVHDESKGENRNIVANGDSVADEAEGVE